MSEIEPPKPDKFADFDEFEVPAEAIGDVLGYSEFEIDPDRQLPAAPIAPPPPPPQSGGASGDQ
ncbi:hypothetical protein [Frankia sp. Cas4]|uniref:hypothetical protein n=1 Tax=Frankia sp. Cas4 TaxID=3073927 RepID=UPI002AD2FDA6|nr:hypothetical protein [Frankia sp. Cas4]